MATLLETLQQRLASQPAPAAAPSPNLEEIMAAKKGKAATAPAAPAGSNVMGDIMQAGSQAAVEQQAQAGQMAAQEIGQQASAVQQKQQLAQEGLASQQRQQSSQLASQAAGQRADVAAAEQDRQARLQAQEQSQTKELTDKATLAISQLASERGISRDNLFANARIENKELAARKDAASLEQKAFLLAMSDKSYLDELSRIGAERNLRDRDAFARAASDQAFGSEMSQLLAKFGFDAAEAAKDRTSKEKIAQLSNGQIIQLADAAARQANLQAQYEGIGKLATTGIDTYAKYGNRTSAPAPAPDAKFGFGNSSELGPSDIDASMESY